MQSKCSRKIEINKVRLGFTEKRYSQMIAWVFKKTTVFV